MSTGGLSLEERMLARSLQQMMGEQRQSRWRFWERWLYDWAADEAYDSKLLQGVWWLFSFPWTVLETCLDFIANVVLLALGLIPPNVLFNTLQFFERCFVFVAGVCSGFFALIWRGLQLCLAGEGGPKKPPARKGNASLEKAAEEAAGLLLREEREASERRAAAAARRSAKKGGGKPIAPPPDAATIVKAPVTTRGRSEAPARPASGRPPPATRSRTADAAAPATANPAIRAGGASPATPERSRGLSTIAACPRPTESMRANVHEDRVAAQSAKTNAPSATAPAPAAPAAAAPRPPKPAEAKRKSGASSPETPSSDPPPQPISSAPVLPNLPPPPTQRLPGFQPLYALAASMEDDEDLPPPLPPPRALAKSARALSLAGVDLPPSFVCPITHELLEDPVVTADGQTYERHAITSWLASHSTSPLTGDRLEHTRLTPNVMARSLIREWVERNGIEVSPRGRSHG